MASYFRAADRAEVDGIGVLNEFQSFRRQGMPGGIIGRAADQCLGEFQRQIVLLRRRMEDFQTLPNDLRADPVAR